MKAIEVINLKKYFGRTKAVDDISFDVEKGEVFGFLGPNGAGKSTTIRCMVDLIRPTNGSVKIFGKDSNAETVAIKDDMTYLPCGSQFYPNWTGQDHIDLVERLRGKSKLTKKYVERLDFNPRVKFKALSTGNKQKLGLILAFIHRPQLVILDEPTSGLDPLLQNQIYEIMKEQAKNGTTIFMSSHNLHEVENNCSRVAIIKQGKLIATENIKTLKQKRVYSVNVVFEHPFNPRDFNGDQTTIKSAKDTELVLTVKGDINPIIQKLAPCTVKSLEITQASLDEIFMEYYERN